MSRSPEDISRRKRRTARVVLAAGLVAALSATGVAPVLADEPTPGGAPPASAKPAKPAGDKLGAADAKLLAEAKAEGDKTITMMVAAQPGSTDRVADTLDAVKGASVGRTYDKLGYVRATVPIARADQAIGAAKRMADVHGIDLKHEIKLPDPTPGADAVRGGSSAKSGSYPAPDKNTPARNPYQPAHETGAVDFVKQNPRADGRGVTIGVIDSGVDLAHPALQKTTTGERKIVDWVTATDPITDNDGTWRPMTTNVSGPSFSYQGRTYTAPAGAYQVSRFQEKITDGGPDGSDYHGDVNRDGDKTDSWALLYDAAKGTVRVDLNDNGDFTDDTPMKPYRDGFQIGYFGTDDPKTPVAERSPFVVEIRKDVSLDPLGGSNVGKKADFVNVGIIESEHGTHVAGITAANKLFGGKMNGAAPGAKVVSSRACSWSGGCTNVALTEGMIDLVTKRGVDIVNMSIGGLPPLNDGNNARSELYTRLIDTYGVQLVISAGNSGPGANTIGDPSLANKVISVGAGVSKETWAANYGSQVKREYNLFPFSSRGPREDGGFTPTLVAPGASINTTQTWIPGSPVKEAGYELPVGYSMLQGTSMASPQAAGASALLLSAAKQRGIKLTPATLRTALTSTAHKIPGVQAYEQGAGRMDIVDAWKSIRRGAHGHAYTVKAPVKTALSDYLKTPGFGTGVYDREGGLKAGQSRTYDVTITRTTGPDRAVRHTLKWRNNSGAFRLAGGSSVVLPLNKPVTVKVVARPGATGVHSAILEVNDRRTEGVDHQILNTVVVAKPLAGPAYAVKESGSVQRNAPTSYFVNVPKGAKTLEVALGGLRDKSQTRFVAINPYGVPVDSTSSIACYPNYDNPANTCRPDRRAYPNPIPGVWEIEVESRRTSPVLDNPYQLTVNALGSTFSPETQTLAEAKVGQATPVEWKVSNGFGPIDGKLQGGPLGSARTERPTIKQGETQTSQVTVAEGASRLDVAIGGAADGKADLDLAVVFNGQVVGESTSSGSDEKVSLRSPKAGVYTIEVAGYAVPAGSTAYDYRDLFFAPSLGELKADGGKRITLANGQSTQVTADVVVAGPAPEGRTFFGELSLVNQAGTSTGGGSVRIGKVIP
ncbi:S8 family serine peptidase [Streptomyces sp. 71268]|uniref:S8 family serine peptidase n=1 Tax=Streptomyces sp. 71268 TaxID=3002640 RepID=UPI0023F87CB2|nr:S8 family serine peptidase [Streptomyces sp. 71268]WEV27832.1 S8 family serine peptidase [Streptomyces sp. 71268]